MSISAAEQNAVVSSAGPNLPQPVGLEHEKPSSLPQHCRLPPTVGQNREDKNGDCTAKAKSIQRQAGECVLQPLIQSVLPDDATCARSPGFRLHV